jgi:pimeloyl-ACP methyl ester carboxylesterase
MDKSWLLGLGLLAACGPDDHVDERFFVRTDDDALLFVHAVGSIASGDAVLLLHGGPGVGAQSYRLAPGMSNLEDGVLMVYLDQRGQGASQGGGAPEDVDLSRLGRDVVQVMEVLELQYLEPRTDGGRLWLMGHSWGGMLGPQVLFRTRAQERLAGWIEVAGAHDLVQLHGDSRDMLRDEAARVLANRPDDADWQGVLDRARRLPAEPGSLETFWALNGVAQEAGALVDEVVFHTPSAASAVGWAWGRPTSWLTDLALAQDTAGELLRPVLQTSWTEDYAGLDVPSLQLAGRWDFVVPRSLARTAAERSVDAELVVFENSGHVPMFNEPRAFSHTVLDFIQGER